MDEYARFAFLYDALVGASLRPIHKDMVASCLDHNCFTVADLCCGTGLFAGLARTAGLIPTGVDLSSDMLSEARRAHPSIKFIESDATATLLQAQSFDATAISFALHEKPSEIGLGILEEAMRITKPGGVIVVGDYHIPESGNKLAGFGIALVERMAGKEHHSCFKAYMEAGGTDGFLRQAGLTPTLLSAHMNGWAGVYVVQRT